MGERSIYLMRHGPTVQTGEKRLVGRFDAPLDEDGLALAHQLAKDLAEAEIAHVVCSPLARSADMGRLIAPALSARLHIEPELSEINLGAWDGLPVAEIRARWPGEYEKRGEDLYTYRPPGGENFHDLQARVLATFSRVTRSLDGNLLIIGHRAVNRALLADILGLPLTEMNAISQAHGEVHVILERAGCLTVEK